MRRYKDLLTTSHSVSVVGTCTDVLRYVDHFDGYFSLCPSSVCTCISATKHCSLKVKEFCDMLRWYICSALRMARESLRVPQLKLRKQLG